MATAPSSMMRSCQRCGQAMPPRNGITPRYCANCGVPLAPLSYARRPPAAARHVTAGEGMAAVLAGVLSLMPTCGLFFAAVAAILAFSMLRQNRGPQRAAMWDVTAIMSLVLAALGTCAWLLMR